MACASHSLGNGRPGVRQLRNEPLKACIPVRQHVQDSALFDVADDGSKNPAKVFFIDAEHARRRALQLVYVPVNVGIRYATGC